MSDIMRPISFSALMNWALEEHKKQKSIFGVPTLYRHQGGSLPIFKEKLETPFGPAAGPHTQLSQNLITAYLAGGRFFELKTVQILDGEDLSVSKPCITAADECYNCEWSTELRVPQAFEEYVRGWFALKLLSRELGLGDADGFVFNMSVGYDLEGIKSPKIDAYIQGMKDASTTAVWAECRDWALANLGRFSKVDRSYVEGISPKISNSITLSTLHGCPPEEIERIASYLITEKNLNTYIKCNPTLLGYESARSILDGLGYDYIAFDDHHFKADLQFADAVPMIERLRELCAARGLEFGVKLTNTFPVQVAAGELPSEEMYMSGRSLFPLTMEVARRISGAFGGKVRISYSGGADAYNIKSLYAAGIWPITMATTLLKPGGYRRMHQIAGLMAECEKKAFAGVDLQALEALAQNCRQDRYYRKPIKPLPQRKISEKVPLLDCYTSPCRGGCPIEQDISAYLRLVGEGKHLEALRVITWRNPLPFITGTICSHRCMDKCVRDYYESSVDIRAAKLEAAEGGYDSLLRELKPAPKKNAPKVAVVGAGAAGIAAAYFLAREGYPVTVFEKREKSGGIVRCAIPTFRITHEAIDKDTALARTMGAEFRYNQKIASPEELRAQGYEIVILAVGAWKPGELRLEYGESLNVLAFLQSLAGPNPPSLGRDVAVVGGGNTAMDAARAAKRVPGVEKVRIVYRRTKRYMPADEEELALALEDGVEFCELLAPVGIKDGLLTCKVMELGAPDESGRRRPTDTGKTTTIPADTLIAAVGEKPDAAFLAAWGVGCDEASKPILNTDLYSEQGQVYVIGDANRGPATVVEAIADAMTVAKAVAGTDFDRYVGENVSPTTRSAQEKKGCLDVTGGCTQPQRCLECATVCELCADVCPNRANVAVTVPGMAMGQILHVDGMCNECGNCETFCPYQSAPYKDKFTLFWSEEDFENSTNEGFFLAEDKVRVRVGGAEVPAPKGLEALIGAAREQYPHLFV